MRAVILAGGESRRMGAPKALLTLGGETLLDRARRTARQATGRCALVSLSAGRLPAPAGLPRRLTVRDADAGRGPAAGVLAALRSPAFGGADALLVLAVDMPFLDADTLRDFLQGAQGAGGGAAVASYRGRVQPVCAILPRTAEPVVARAARDARGLRWILAQTRARAVPIARRAGPSPFTSVDTPAALRRARAYAESRPAARHVSVATRSQSADTSVDCARTARGGRARRVVPSIERR